MENLLAMVMAQNPLIEGDARKARGDGRFRNALRRGLQPHALEP